MIWSAAMLAATLGMMPAVANAAADLSGVWVVTTYSREIKTATGATPPLRPEVARLYQQSKASLKHGDDSFDPVAQRCGAPGFPRIMAMPYAFEIAQNPGRVVFMFEWNRLYRRINIDAPSHNADDLQFTGRSSAHWEGDTLVVDVRQIDETLLDASGMPHSKDLKVTERFRLRGDKSLEDRMRFDDPKTFREPWETVVTYRKLPADYELKENICLDRLRTHPAIEDANYLTYPK